MIKDHIDYREQDKYEFKALVNEFKVFQKETLSNKQSSSHDLNSYMRKTEGDISKFITRALKLKKDFEGLLSSGHDFENVVSLAYVSMVYYHTYHEIINLTPPTSHGEAHLNFLKSMHKKVYPLLFRSKHAQIIFRKSCIRWRLVDQCVEFRRTHQSELPKPTLNLSNKKGKTINDTKQTMITKDKQRIIKPKQKYRIIIGQKTFKI